MPQGRSLEELRQRYGARYRWLVLLTVMVGAMASLMASTIVNVAIPDLSRHFALGQAQAQWVSAGFMVAVTVSMLLTPWLLRRFGLRGTYTGAIVLLSLGALAGGLASSFGLVLAMRALEGACAGVLQTLPAVVILRAFGPHEKGRAMGIFGFGVVLAPAIGPSVGGLLVDSFGWRSIFFVMLPFGVVGLTLARRYLPLAVATADRSPPDWRGLLLIGGGTVSLMVGLVEWQNGSSVTAAALSTLAALLIAGFIALQRRLADPLMNLALFRHRSFAVGALVAFIYGIGLFGSTYLIPVFLQEALQYGATEAGLVLLPAGLVLAVSMPLTGRLADLYPAHVLVAIGLALLTSSFALLATVGSATPYALLLAWVIVSRMGLSFVLPALSLGAMREVAREQIAQGSSTINFMRQLGGAVGISLAGIGLAWRLDAHGVTLAGEGALDAQRIAAFDETFFGVAVVCACATLVALRMRPAAGPV